jgi:hypothetical protein
LLVVGNLEHAIFLAFNTAQQLRLVVHQWCDVLTRLLSLLCLTHGYALDLQPPSDGADFGPMLPGMLIAFLVLCFLALLLGIFTALVLAGFITVGIISASVMTAVLKRSVSSGFRALFLQIGGVLGLITGAVGAMLFIWLAKIPSDSPQPWIIGLIAGLLWGVLSALLFNFAWHRIVEWIAAKLPLRKTELPEMTSTHLTRD